MFSRESPFPMPVSKSTLIDRILDLSTAPSELPGPNQRVELYNRMCAPSTAAHKGPELCIDLYDSMMFVTNSEIAPNGKEEPVMMSLGTQVQSVTSCSYFSS